MNSHSLIKIDEACLSYGFSHSPLPFSCFSGIAVDIIKDVAYPTTAAFVNFSVIILHLETCIVLDLWSNYFEIIIQNA